MSKNMISENDIYRLIMEELNDNILNKDGIKAMNFEMANFYTEDNEDKLYIMKQSFNVENGRFDIVEEFNEETYVSTKKRFTAVGIGELNESILSHPKIIEANYSPIVNFLVYVGDGNGDNLEFLAHKLVIEDIRRKLIHKDRIFDVEYFNIEDLESDTKIKETLKIVFSSGELQYGSLEVINGKFYMVISMPLNIFATNSGEFSNQQTFEFSVSDIIDEVTNKPKVFEIPLLTWYYAKAVDTTDFMLMATRKRSPLGIRNSAESRSIPNSKAFALNFLVQIDFEDEFLTHIYEESQNVRENTPIYTITMRTTKYDKDLKEYVELTSNTRNYLLIQNAPLEELSLGEKLEHVLTFTVTLND